MPLARTLIAALRDVIDSLCGSAWAINRPAHSGAAEVPVMKEFLQFAWADRQYVMRKRQWPLTNRDKKLILWQYRPATVKASLTVRGVGRRQAL